MGRALFTEGSNNKRSPTRHPKRGKRTLRKVKI